jgi:hypothetical protein
VLVEDFAVLEGPLMMLLGLEAVRADSHIGLELTASEVVDRNGYGLAVDALVRHCV